MDYDVIAKKYDLTRAANTETLGRLISGAGLTARSVAVDFGCGTGNFAHALAESTGARVIGVEPSDGMREAAAQKGGSAVFLKGDHTNIPLGDDAADFIYMTDVIHHVPDIGAMFREFSRVLRPGGRACVVTESHSQLESRFWVRYFPASVGIEKARYPDIADIVAAAAGQGLRHLATDSTDAARAHAISPEFAALVRNKGYSIFDLIDGESFRLGLEALERDLESGVAAESVHGESFVWFENP